MTTNLQRGSKLLKKKQYSEDSNYYINNRSLAEI